PNGATLIDLPGRRYLCLANQLRKPSLLFDTMSPPSLSSRPSFDSFSSPIPIRSAVEKDVQALLMKQRSSRRRPGQSIYPLQYSRDMINFDNWDQMFFQNCFGGLTMHQFDSDSPPRRILDLGCGGGYWAIEAARRWPDAEVIGFDLTDIQPDLMQLDAHYMRCLEDSNKSPHSLPIVAELAGRLKWVHGNLLDGLPFASNFFDYVHIAGIGLGVPEDEWQYVLEDVYRVMEYNGVIEIVEEDLIFPCSPPPPARRFLAPLNLDFTRRERKDSAPPSAFSIRSSSTMLSDQSSVPGSPVDVRIHKRPSLPTLPEAHPDYQHSRSSIPFDTDFSPDGLFTQDSEVYGTDPSDGHPQDHTRLKTAWDAMLTKRFLTPGVTTVMPFYLSTLFDNLQTHPSLHVPLPASSFEMDSDSRSSGESYSDAVYYDQTRRLSKDVDRVSIQSKSTTSSHRITPYWARMHLGKAVSSVSACKEAIWMEYSKLNPNALPPVISKTMNTRARTRMSYHSSSTREAFETDWSNWEHDMADRIAMRNRAGSDFRWSEPEFASDWRIWRDRMITHDTEIIEEPPRSSNICRSLRAFVAWKPPAPLPSSP
ncbi:unnamed protein product, partial [Mycena citricolor]